MKVELIKGRREVLVLSASVVAGCVNPLGGNGGDETQPGSTEDEKTMTGTDEGSEIDRLPEPSPLADPLPGLVEANDREAFVNEHGLEYRNGEIKVEIELEPNGERPDQYISEVVDAFSRLVIAWVKIDKLVDLAIDENVRRVQPPTEPKPDTPE